MLKLKQINITRPNKIPSLVRGYVIVNNKGKIVYDYHFMNKKKALIRKEKLERG